MRESIPPPSRPSIRAGSVVDLTAIGEVLPSIEMPVQGPLPDDMGPLGKDMRLRPTDPAQSNPDIFGPSSEAIPELHPLSKALPTSFRPETRHAGIMFPSLGPEILQPPYNPPQVTMARVWSPEVSDSIDTFLERMFRQELFYEPAFARRCDDCEMDFEEDLEECPICQGETREPDKEQEKLAKQWLEYVNTNHMTLQQFCRILTDKALTYDDAFILKLFDYKVNMETAEIDWEETHLKEFWLGSTERIRLIFDEAYQKTGYVKDDQGNKHGFFTCLLHRETLFQTEGRCTHKGCKLPLHPVVAVGMDINGMPTHGYLDNEVLHWSPRNPSEGYGFSRVATLMTLIRTIAAMDDQQRLIYAFDRPLKGFVWFNTENQESLQAQFRKEEAIRGRNPHYMPKFAIQSQSKSGGAGFVPLTPTYDELQNIEQRKDLYRRIWSAWEVEPIFMADTSSGGGLNNEGRQLTVNLQAVEANQSDWHEVLFPWMQKAIGLTDYNYRFPTPAEKDEAADTLLRQTNLTMRMMIEQFGGEVEVTNEDTWEFKITNDPEFDIMEAPGGLGGAGGFGQFGRQQGGGGVFGQDGGQGEDALEIEKSMLEENYEYTLQKEFKFFNTLARKLNEMLTNLKSNFANYRTKGEQEDAVASIVDFSVEQMRTGAVEDLANTLKTGIKRAGVDPTELGIDLNVVHAMTQGSPVWQSFADFSTEMSTEIADIVGKIFLEPTTSIAEMTDRIAAKVGGDRHKLRRIARTETNRVRNLGREMGYKSRDPEGDFRYKWVGPIDNRNVGKLRNGVPDPHPGLIRETAANPLPLDELKELVKVRGSEYMGPEWTITDWTIHPNQRGNLVRVVI